MRLDKFLKVSRIIKRRTVAKEVCDTGRVLVNGRVAKPGTNVKVGDIIEIQYAAKTVKAEVLLEKEHVTKDEAKDMYRILQGEEIE
ncbi:MAG: RNA-binding protein [Caloramator sp.]|jgi:ribosomal 50S subunit-recycling heat shock protein|uniref:RQC P-site tRNA stabilizing factor n=1 Tax=Caloramator proteoclasticus DSM 10124 TaxID=1121262 RepID=A0A1M4YMW8_9CLOT|nr:MULTISPECIES: RNA-binding S4 domain-containing protein [Caloramator]MBZ4662641.1 RNA-binding protein [Caloramator sp.]SHF06842.1 Ribosomal 50S subunit-recycling heat shock protein, contains S4 domain [Caloramator proteoclasticus DSM 10124]